MTDNCPLCQSSAEIFYQQKNRIYYQCNNCLGIFVDKKLLPDREDEEFRYREHNNDIEDKGYQKFVSPITQAIFRDFTSNHLGLDFGAGTGPVISKVLKDRNFNIKEYDPFFHNYPQLLENKYDYIACCEVIEHFHDPYKEFALLKSLISPNGKLYCLTHIYKPEITFDNWYYKNDRTHVFFYQKETLEWIKEEFGFSEMIIEGRLITFSL